jgi:hypothetical protein
MAKPTLGIHAGTFRDAPLGCAGAIVPVVLTSAALLGLVAMVWWYVLGPGGPSPTTSP